jgi:hypothetical protein
MRGEVDESGAGLTVETNRGVNDCWMEGVERLDELIGRYLPVALSAEQDSDRALRASCVVLELIELKTTLLNLISEALSDTFLP